MHFNATEITISYNVGIDDVFNAGTEGEGEDVRVLDQI